MFLQTQTEHRTQGKAGGLKFACTSLRDATGCRGQRVWLSSLCSMSRVGSNTSRYEAQRRKKKKFCTVGCQGLKARNNSSSQLQRLRRRIFQNVNTELSVFMEHKEKHQRSGWWMINERQTKKLNVPLYLADRGPVGNLLLRGLEIWQFTLDSFKEDRWNDSSCLNTWRRSYCEAFQPHFSKPWNTQGERRNSNKARLKKNVPKKSEWSKIWSLVWPQD